MNGQSEYAQPGGYRAGAVNGGGYQQQQAPPSPSPSYQSAQQQQQQQQYQQYQQQQQQQQQQQVQSRTSTSSNASGPGPSSGQIPTAAEKKGADYVVFDRQPAQTFSKDAIARATGAKMKLEQFYKVAVESAIERNNRYVRFSLFVLVLGFMFESVWDTLRYFSRPKEMHRHLLVFLFLFLSIFELHCMDVVLTGKRCCWTLLSVHLDGLN